MAHYEGVRIAPPAASAKTIFAGGSAVTRNSFGARGTLNVNDSTFEIFRLDALDGATRLPYSLKVLLENLLRNEDGYFTYSF